MKLVPVFGYLSSPRCPGSAAHMLQRDFDPLPIYFLLCSLSAYNPRLYTHPGQIFGYIPLWLFSAEIAITSLSSLHIDCRALLKHPFLFIRAPFSFLSLRWRYTLYALVPPPVISSNSHLNSPNYAIFIYYSPFCLILFQSIIPKLALVLHFPSVFHVQLFSFFLQFLFISSNFCATFFGKCTSEIGHSVLVAPVRHSFNDACALYFGASIHRTIPTSVHLHAHLRLLSHHVFRQYCVQPDAPPLTLV